MWNKKQWWHKYGRYSIYIMYLICIAFFLAPIIIDYRTNNHSASNFLAKKFGFITKDDSTKDFYTFWVALWGVIGIVINIIHSQIRIQNQDKQIDLQSKSQRDSRFSKGIELLGNDNESARTGAAYSLYFLAKDYPDEFSKPVFDILCSHIRTLTTSEDYLKKHPTVSNEVQTILNLLLNNARIFYLCVANFSKANLIEANLIGANLNKANLKGANLKGANLRNAHLNRAHLNEADLTKADLTKADLEEAFLIKTDLRYADLRYADLSEADLTEADLTKADLTKADLTKADLTKANLSEADLTEAYLSEANLKGANLSEAYLSGVDFSKDLISYAMKPFLEQSGANLVNVKWIDNDK